MGGFPKSFSPDWWDVVIHSEAHELGQWVFRCSVSVSAFLLFLRAGTEYPQEKSTGFSDFSEQSCLLCSSPPARAHTKAHVVSELACGGGVSLPPLHPA